MAVRVLTRPEAVVFLGSRGSCFAPLMLWLSGGRSYWVVVSDSANGSYDSIRAEVVVEVRTSPSARRLWPFPDSSPVPTPCTSLHHPCCAIPRVTHGTSVHFVIQLHLIRGDPHVA